MIEKTFKRQTWVNDDFFHALNEKKEAIRLSPMTKALTPIEKFKRKRDNTKNAIKNFDYTTIADRLRKSMPHLLVRQISHLNGKMSFTT